jgi:hypothetical protein
LFDKAQRKVELPIHSGDQEWAGFIPTTYLIDVGATIQERYRGFGIALSSSVQQSCHPSSLADKRFGKRWAYNLRTPWKVWPDSSQ